MSARLMGFVGVDKYDIIHYLASTLTVLNKRVLVVDSSMHGSITCTMPSIYRCERGIFNYRDFDVVLHPDFSMIDFNQYDFVLVDFGFDIKNRDMVRMHEVYMVTDMQMQNVLRFKELELWPYQERFLVVRDIVRLRSVDNYIIEEFLDKSVGPDNTFAVQLDETDKIRMLDCMYNADYKFKDLSEPMRSLLYGIMSPYFKEKEFYKAFKTAAKGGK